MCEDGCWLVVLETDVIFRDPRRDNQYIHNTGRGELRSSLNGLVLHLDISLYQPPRLSKAQHQTLDRDWCDIAANLSSGLWLHETIPTE